MSPPGGPDPSLGLNINAQDEDRGPLSNTSDPHLLAPLDDRLPWVGEPFWSELPGIAEISLQNEDSSYSNLSLPGSRVANRETESNRPDLISTGGDDPIGSKNFELEPHRIPETEIIPDLQALDMLRETVIPKDYTIKNTHLELEPHLIPGSFYAYHNFDLVANDTLALQSGGGSWRKHGREMGWGIKDPDGTKFVGLKRTFVFTRGGKAATRTDWIMNVYALVEGVERRIRRSITSRDGVAALNTTKYMCNVFRRNVYDPRPPLDRSHLAIALDPALVAAPGEECGKLLHISRGTGIAGGKKPKSTDDVWSKYTKVSASSGPAGEVLKLAICNSCGQVYKASSGTSTLGNHKCSN